ncbi:TPA: hypothetical protein ACH3X3_014441 [Trebouxia sp. C0006]
MKMQRPPSLLATADKCGCKLWQAFLLWVLPTLLLALHSSCVEAGTAETVAGRRAQSVRPRGLQAVAPLSPTADGWMQGRVTFFNPSSLFIKSLRNSPFKFEPVPDRDRGLYNGGNKKDNSAITVPANMLASMVTSNPDYPGSCGRCYELRCQTGVVAGNFSSDNTPVPYRIGPAQSQPPYQFTTFSGQPPLDDFNRSFPGNPLNSSDVVFTQCWNLTDSLRESSVNNTIIVQVTDSCVCSASATKPASSNFCCTNIPTSVLGFSAFERLVHPDYGYMNLEYRPVACDHPQQLLPVHPGFISKTIYADAFEAVWGVGGYQVARELQSPGAGLAQSNASCFTFQNSQDTLFFFCRECDQAGYQPFLLSNTSGLQFFIKQNGTSSGGSSLPALKLTLASSTTSNGNVAYQQLCTGSSVDLSQLPASDIDQATGFVGVTAGLLHNSFQDCIASLDQITSFEFQLSSTASTFSPVSFCLDDISLLPPTLQTGLNNSAPAIPSYSNCYIPDPQLIYQNGSYVPGRQIQSTQNVSEYTVFPFADLEGYDDMTPTLGTCFVNTTGLSINNTLFGLVDGCTQQNRECCYDAANVGDQESTLPGRLANICDAMASNGSICQGFVHNSFTGTAFFKGNATDTPIDTSQLCLSPNSTAWLLSSALQGSPDTRQVASITIPPARPVCQYNPQPTAQDLHSSAQASQLTQQELHNVTGNTSESSSAYTAYPNADLQNYLDLEPPAGTSCCMLGAANVSAVEKFAMSKKGLCCVFYSDLTSIVDNTVAQTLANVCNTVQFGNIMCQGFVYDRHQNVAFFKGQATGQLVDTSRLCTSSNTTAWLSNIATTGGTVATQSAPTLPAAPPLPPPPSTGAQAKTAYGVVAGVLAACVPAFTWLAITYSYRMDKRMVVAEVVKNVRPADISSRSPLQPVDSAVVRPVWVPQGDSNPFMSAMQAGRSRSMQRINSAPSSARQSNQFTGGFAPSRQLSTASDQASLHPVQSDMVHNPLLAPGTMRTAPGHVALDRGGMHDARLDSTSEMKSVAKQITVRCLRGWDGLLGIRAGSDGLGRRSGIWRDKFDGVRYGVLLLAMSKLNADLLSSSTQPSEYAWLSSAILSCSQS